MGETWSRVWSVVTAVYDDLNAMHTDVDYGVVGGIGFVL
jgi:hypothetical protein